MTDVLHMVSSGARTPLGLSSDAAAAAVEAGISRLQEFAFASEAGLPVVLARQ